MILAVGILTLVAGIVLVLRHLHVWRQKVDAGVAPEMKIFLNRQLRRRCLTSSCIAILGFVLATMHFREFWVTRPGGYFILLYCSLALTFMIFVLALLDFAASATGISTQRAEARKAAEDLAREYIRIRTRKKIVEGDHGNRTHAEEHKPGRSDPA